MEISLRTVMDKLSPEQRARVEQRKAELIAEEITLQDLRKAREFKDRPSPGAAIEKNSKNPLV